ncbi:Cytochrome c551/c552 [Acidisarcina polymorpha]|uniref:Cytochrome c551/c552 n=1 Tax=Acidisarcina polymorpha TaxID=2211140 RepID=A0A2Z5FXV4_9BACT|nr:ThuA domain-containing protein [Acidisarcina polymorpha]AXC11708.1 Cytochrome c551/c552 [Acidisarcina polymorpha]
MARPAYIATSSAQGIDPMQHKVCEENGGALKRPSISTLLALLFLCAAAAQSAFSAETSPKFRVIVLAEKGGIHQPFVDAGKIWLNELAAKDNFAVDYIEDTAPVNDAFLARYQLFIQLNYAPYNWTPTAQAAFIKYIEQGKGGWIGFHHATLLGEFDGFQMWPWFSKFMGGIRFTAYIPTFADGVVTIEDPAHPTMKGVASPFLIQQEEWYTWDKSPRPNVHVLASVDESTYKPDTKTKMGDHPVIWTNPNYKARNIYIFMGHHPELFQNPAFTRIFTNSIYWAAQQ